MGFFDIEHDLLSRQLLPVRLRKTIHIAWIGLIAYPFKWVYNKFKANRTANLYELNHNSQVCYLQAVLNDTFDNDLRRIYIGDPEYIDPVYVYREDEEKPIWLATDGELPVTEYDAPVYVFRDSEVYATGVQFIVYVPEDLMPDIDEVRMRALIDKYRLASKNNYTIVTF